MFSTQAFGQAYSNQRKVAEDGETNEEALLQESASKEAFYTSRLVELQTELHMRRSHASNSQAENERLNLHLQELREVRTSRHNYKRLLYNISIIVNDCVWHIRAVTFRSVLGSSEVRPT